MQVEVPTTLTTSPSRTPAPMASQCASKAPTGMGMPARRPSFSAHSAREVAGDLVGGLVAAGRVSRARRRAADRHAARNSSGGKPPSAAFHIHLWPMAQMLRGTLGRVGDAAQHGGHHVAMFQRGGEAVALVADCGAASAAAWRSPIRRSRCRRTSRWRRARGRARRR